MSQLPARVSVAVAVCLVLASSADAQFTERVVATRIKQIAAVTQGELRGTVVDDQRRALAGVVVSAVGSTTVFAVTERDGSYVLRNLPSGPYLLRVHLQGYVAPRARVVQVNGGSQSVTAIAMSARDDAAREVLEAGVGPRADVLENGDGSPLDRSEMAWRLRHLKRSVLKDAAIDVLSGDDFLDAQVPVQASATATPGGWFAELPFSGRVDLLTSTSFDRPQQLLSLDVATPTGVTTFALGAPVGLGDWSVRGGLTQGDIASWLVSSEFTRTGQTSHHYTAGVSYGAQRYLGGNAYLMAALADGNRNVGEVFASDVWTPSRSIEVSYGASLARYDYLNGRALVSPNVGFELTPDGESGFKVRASIARREVAPGAEEFVTPTTSSWVPAQRTFSPLSWRTGFERQRVDTAEVSAERNWIGDFTIGVRAFKQNVDGQMVTVFGLSQPSTPVASLGHYFVASGGDFEARGWGLSVRRKVLEGVQASVDYTVTDANWVRTGSDTVRLSSLAPSAVRADTERNYDLRAAVESEVPQTATRFFVLYRINSGFATSDMDSRGGIGTRFDVQVNQALPFMKFATSQWEMLVAVRNMFYENQADGSLYDELMVLRAPKRIVGGLSVRF